MIRSRLKFHAVLLLVATIALPAIGAPDMQRVPPVKVIDPVQYLVDKEAVDLVAIVKVKQSEIRWVILPDGDNLSLYVADVEMIQVLAGSPDWPVGSRQTVMQYDYSDLIFEPISPPVIGKHRYLLFATRTPKDGETPALALWTAHAQGFPLLRGGNANEFVYWNGKAYGVAAIRESLKVKRLLPLDKIIDPMRRLRIAESRMRDGNVGDEKAFVHGLLMNVVDPDGQAKNVEPLANSLAANDMFGMSKGSGQPHGIWYNSLTRLRDFGKRDSGRSEVAKALTPIAQTGRPPIRLATALALVDLGSDAGRNALIRGFETESGPISSDPPDTMTFPGRYPYDQSSVLACAHALARLGDRRGLRHMLPDVRLAAASALVEKPDAELKMALQALVAEILPDVEKLRTSGELAKTRRPGDYTNRYPANWVRALQLHARTGDDGSFRQLVEAYRADADTYPKEETALMPRGRMSSWSSNGLSPARGIRDSHSTPSKVLERLHRLFSQDNRWDNDAFKALRDSLVETPPSAVTRHVRPKPTEIAITELLNSVDPAKRAEGLAAAGYHHMDMFYAKVLEVALTGVGVEKNAAIYSLGLYGRDVSEAVLRQLLATQDLELRFNSIELATRKDAVRFAQETMDFVRAKISQTKAANADDWNLQRELAYLPRIVSRLARGPIPPPMQAGLKDPEPTVRRIVVQAMELSGNPDSVKYIQPLTRDPNKATKEASRQAIRTLGPMK